jgi:hypothetical protein
MTFYMGQPHILHTYLKCHHPSFVPGKIPRLGVLLSFIGDLGGFFPDLYAQSSHPG